MLVPNRIMSSGRWPPYDLGPPTGGIHQPTKHIFKSVVGKQEMPLALQHYARPSNTCTDALEKASFGFSSFEDPPSLLWSPDAVSAASLAITSYANAGSWGMTELFEPLKSYAAGGLSNSKSVGCWMRFMSPSWMRNEAIRKGTLTKRNEVVAQWRGSCLMEYSSWLN